MRIPLDSNPFDVLIEHVTDTIKVEEMFVRRFERHRRKNVILAVILLAFSAVLAGFGNPIGWVYVILGVGMIGMAFYAQFCIIRTEKWLEEWREDLALFQLGSIEWENGEFPHWVIRKAEASGRYVFSEG